MAAVMAITGQSGGCTPDCISSAAAVDERTWRSMAARQGRAVTVSSAAPQFGAVEFVTAVTDD